MNESAAGQEVDTMQCNEMVEKKFWLFGPFIFLSESEFLVGEDKPEKNTASFGRYQDYAPPQRKIKK